VTLISIGFGGGCHWCTEAVFSNTPEAFDVMQGWIGSTGENISLSEAVLLKCELGDLEKLIYIHLKTHSSTSDHQLRHKYRSAVYYTDSKHKELILNTLRSFSKNIITKALPLEDFKLNDEKYLNYYEKNKGNQFCETYIEPKLKNISHMPKA
jgi:peptide-methionine (S)-S-oxide reductase